MESGKVEILLRIGAASICVITACVIGLDRQTKLLFGVLNKTATYTDLKALSVLVWIVSVVGVYNAVQVLRHYYFSFVVSSSRRKKPMTTDDQSSYMGGLEPSTLQPLPVLWVVFILDQVMAYIVFASNTAAIQGSMLAVTGETSLNWMKLCDKFSRFCVQIGGALFCGYVVSVLMIIISSISAYSVFRLYSPKRLLFLKGNLK